MAWVLVRGAASVAPPDFLSQRWHFNKIPGRRFIPRRMPVCRALVSKSQEAFPNARRGSTRRRAWHSGSQGSGPSKAFPGINRRLLFWAFTKQGRARGGWVCGCGQGTVNNALRLRRGGAPTLTHRGRRTGGSGFTFPGCLLWCWARCPQKLMGVWEGRWADQERNLRIHVPFE